MTATMAETTMRNTFVAKCQECCSTGPGRARVNLAKFDGQEKTVYAPEATILCPKCRALHQGYYRLAQEHRPVKRIKDQRTMFDEAM